MPETNVLDADLNNPATKLKLLAKGSGDIELDKCKAKITIDGKAEAPKAMTVGGDSATLEVTLPAVKDDKLSYPVSWALVYKDKEIEQPDKWMVWPETIKIVTKNEDGSKAFAKVPFDWTVDGKATRYETNDKGEMVIHGQAADWLAKGFTIALPSSWEDQKKDPGVGRVRTYHIKRVAVAEFVSPKADTTQFVNLTVDPSHPEFGHTVPIKVGIKDKGGIKGDEIFIKATFGMESKRNKPKPELTDAEGIAASDDGTKKVYKGKVKLGDNGDPVTFKIELGYAGQLTCVVEIGTTDECKDVKITFTTMRKLYFHFTRLKSFTAPSPTGAKNAFKDVGIDFEQYTVPSAELEDTDPTIPAGALVDAAMLEKGKVGKALVIGDHNVGPFKDKFQKKLEGPSAHIILCHYQLDAKNLVYNAALPVGVTDKIDWPPSAPMAPKKRGITIDASQTGEGDALFFAKDLTDGLDAVKECKWTCVEDKSKKGTVDAADITIDHPNLGNKIYIKLPDDAALLMDGGKTIQISIKVAYALGWYNGWCTSSDRHTVIKGGRPDKDINGTIVHECGHALNQAAEKGDDTKFPGLDPPPTKYFYDSTRGHQGPHCATGIADATYKNASANIADAGDSVCICIMYGAGTDTRNKALSFCTHCKPFVLGVEVTEVTTC